MPNRELAAAVFGDIIERGDYTTLARRVILCAFNRQLRYWNEMAIRLLPTREFFEWRSEDSIGGMKLGYFEEYPRFPPKLLRLRANALLQLLREASNLPAATILRKYYEVDLSYEIVNKVSKLSLAIQIQNVLSKTAR